MQPPKALFFDVFGTCVDWRSSIAREGAALGHRLGLEGVDWTRFADAWRARYQPQMETVRSGSRPWVRLEVLNREALDRVLAEFGLEHVGAAERDALNLAWRRLQPWPDVVEGITRLKARFIVAPVSNGDIALMLGLAKHAGLPWDVILGAEIARSYKPQPETYLRCVAAAGLEPADVVMVAAHNEDLRAASACGLQTAFVARPAEHGPDQTRDLRPEAPYSYVAADFVDLARRLGA